MTQRFNGSTDRAGIQTWKRKRKIHLEGSSRSKFPLSSSVQLAGTLKTAFAILFFPTVVADSAYYDVLEVHVEADDGKSLAGLVGMV